jgi:putative methionine-R-sulfoxide reductase with GAF domain
MGNFKSLFNKLLGFLLLCLVCSGGIAVVLIRGQMTQLAYTQMRLLFESDFRNMRTFLQGKADWLLAVAHDLAKDELLKTGLELEVFDQVRNIAESRKTALGLSEVLVINAQKRLVSRGDARRDMLDPQVDAALADKAFGGIEFGGRYQVFGQTALTTPDGKLLARVVVMQPLSAAFFQELKAVLGKDAMVFAGTREVGSTFAQPPGPLQPAPVAPGLFTAFNKRFLGTERDLGDVIVSAGWRVVLLETAAPLLRSLRQVQWGSVLFVLLFMSLIALVLGLFFAANIRQPMRMIQQGIAAVAQGNLATHLHLGRRDEWRLIEEALNRMTTSLAHHETALQHKVVEITTLYEIGQEIAAQVDLEAILHLIVERARTLLEAEASLLALRHEASDTFQMQAHSGRVPQALATLQLRSGEGLGGRVIATGMPVVVHDYLAEFGDSPFLTAAGAARARAAVAVPLKTQGRVIGVLYVYSSVPNAFTEDHRQILSALADQTAIAIEKTTLYQQLSAHAAELESRVQERTAQLAEANAEITALNAQLQAENLRMGAELDVTRKLQYMLLPTAEELHQIADLDIACYMEPADEVGGDYYDVLQHNGLIKIGIGDVTGHGLESGMLMVMTQAIVRALLANGETDPVRFLATLNRTLYGNVQRMGTDKNLTLALLDYAAGEARLSGQHENMLVVRCAPGRAQECDQLRGQ